MYTSEHNEARINARIKRVSTASQAEDARIQRERDLIAMASAKLALAGGDMSAAPIVRRLARKHGI